MIARLKGQVVPNSDESVIVDVNGVGYEVFVSEHTRIASLDSASVNFWVHTHVREDSFQLFGFASRAEKDLFMSLNKVSGIGPKVAMKIISGAPLTSIVQMIDDGDVRGLSKLPKVGKKTAEQIVLELKGKLVLESEGSRPIGFSSRADIVSALINLGFRLTDVEKAVDQMDPSTNFADGVRLGLATLSNC